MTSPQAPAVVLVALPRPREEVRWVDMEDPAAHTGGRRGAWPAAAWP
jgi:hypothetical protein